MDDAPSQSSQTATCCSLTQAINMLLHHLDSVERKKRNGRSIHTDVLEHSYPCTGECIALLTDDDKLLLAGNVAFHQTLLVDVRLATIVIKI